MNKRIDELGRLCIPKAMRNELGINDNDLVNIECKDNKIIITKPDTIDYKQRIDKAIEFIELNIRDIDYDTEEYDYLMNILKGE